MEVIAYLSRASGLQPRCAHSFWATPELQLHDRPPEHSFRLGPRAALRLFLPEAPESASKTLFGGITALNFARSPASTFGKRRHSSEP